MINLKKVEAVLSRYPLAAVAAYVAMVVLFAFLTLETVFEVLQSRAAAQSAADILQTLESRDPAHRPAVRSDVSVVTGSPFLEGPTISVAGATLLQRVLAATKRVNGNTLSSQVDLQGPQSKTGMVSATFNLEIAATALQPLLYDLEAGMPFLFVDDLVIQASSGSAESGKLRVVLGVSAQRESTK
jgi:general secretion pathway protein M